jgi:hypothetical protein
MSYYVLGPVKVQCAYCEGHKDGSLPAEHYHTIQFEYDETCEFFSLVVDGKLLFNVDRTDMKPIEDEMRRLL